MHLAKLASDYALPHEELEDLDADGDTEDTDATTEEEGEVDESAGM